MKTREERRKGGKSRRGQKGIFQRETLLQRLSHKRKPWGETSSERRRYAMGPRLGGPYEIAPVITIFPAPQITLSAITCKYRHHLPVLAILVISDLFFPVLHVVPHVCSCILMVKIRFIQIFLRVKVFHQFFFFMSLNTQLESLIKYKTKSI